MTQIKTMSTDECRQHNLKQLLRLVEQKEGIKNRDVLNRHNPYDKDDLNSYKNMINEYFNKHKNIFQYTDAILELKLLSENKKYRDMVKKFINDKAEYDLAASQKEKTDLIKEIFNEDSKINNIDKIKKTMSTNIHLSNEKINQAINQAKKDIEKAEGIINNRNLWVILLDLIIDFFCFGKSTKKEQSEIIKKNKKIINTLKDTNKDITENLITNFDKLLKDERLLQEKTEVISKKIEQITELEEGIDKKAYLEYLQDEVNKIIDGLYNENTTYANFLKEGLQKELNKKDNDKEIDEKDKDKKKIEVCKKFLQENFNLSVNGGIKTTLLNTPKEEMAPKLNNIVEQMYANTKEATKEKTKKFLEEKLKEEDNATKIVFLSEVNPSSSEEINQYDNQEKYQVDIAGKDIAVISNRKIAPVTSSKNPLGTKAFIENVQIVKHDDMTIYHMHNSSNSAEMEQLNSFTEKLGQSDQLGIMVGDFNYGFDNIAAGHVMVIKADNAENRLKDLGKLVGDMKNAGKTMIYLQPYQNINVARGPQPGNQQNATKVNIENKPDNNGILLNRKFLEEMISKNNEIKFTSTNHREVLNFDHNTASLDIINQNAQKISLIVQNLFDDKSSKNNIVQSNISNVTNQNALNNLNDNVSALFYDNHYVLSQEKKSIEDITKLNNTSKTRNKIVN